MLIDLIYYFKIFKIRFTFKFNKKSLYIGLNSHRSIVTKLVPNTFVIKFIMYDIIYI